MLTLHIHPDNFGFRRWCEIFYRLVISVSSLRLSIFSLSVHHLFSFGWMKRIF